MVGYGLYTWVGKIDVRGEVYKDTYCSEVSFVVGAFVLDLDVSDRTRENNRWGELCFKDKKSKIFA